MKNIDLGQMTTVLANLSVIAGIIFLGVQINQTNQIALADTQAARYLSGIEAFRLLAENGDYAEVMNKDRTNQELTDTEELRLNAFWAGTLLTNQLAYRQLGDEGMADFVGIRRSNNARFPSYRRTWVQRANTFDAGFVRFMNENVFTETP